MLPAALCAGACTHRASCSGCFVRIALQDRVRVWFSGRGHATADGLHYRWTWQDPECVGCNAGAENRPMQGMHLAMVFTWLVTHMA